MVLDFTLEDKSLKKLAELRKHDAENLTRLMSEKYGVPYIDLSVTTINIDALRVMTEDRARETNVAPFNIVDKKLDLAIISPTNEKTKEAVVELQGKGFDVRIHMASFESLKKVWGRYADLSLSTASQGGSLDISSGEIDTFIGQVNNIEDVKNKIAIIVADKQAYRITRLLEIVIAGALATKASDVHLEPEETFARLRYRLDGVLVNITNFDLPTFSLLLSRIKLLSGMKLNIKTAAQDGRFSIKATGVEIEIRSSILPGAYDESVVLRVLNPKSISVPLEELGIHPKLLEILMAEIAKPNGMILNTGPTGSGKTTTLYAFLKKVHSSDIKIITIENPIEYHLPGIVQTQTNTERGYTFLEGLRSALRQDPDIIMVGEIRDRETAEIAVNSALTGHLVFSTLHTNNAAGTYPRLIDLGVNPKVLTSALTVAMAQRLVRKLCVTCKKEIDLPESQRGLVLKIAGRIDPAYRGKVQTQSVWEPQGCKECNFTGYKGRVGIYEVIKSDEKIEKVVNENPSEREIWRAAESQHIPTMIEDGILKVLSGTTSLSELERVVEIKED